MDYCSHPLPHSPSDRSDKAVNLELISRLVFSTPFQLKQLLVISGEQRLKYTRLDIKETRCNVLYSRSPIPPLSGLAKNGGIGENSGVAGVTYLILPRKGLFGT